MDSSEQLVLKKEKRQSKGYGPFFSSNVETTSFHFL